MTKQMDVSKDRTDNKRPVEVLGNVEQPPSKKIKRDIDEMIKLYKTAFAFYRDKEPKKVYEILEKMHIRDLYQLNPVMTTEMYSVLAIKVSNYETKNHCLAKIKVGLSTIDPRALDAKNMLKVALLLERCIQQLSTHFNDSDNILRTTQLLDEYSALMRNLEPGALNDQPTLVIAQYGTLAQCYALLNARESVLLVCEQLFNLCREAMVKISVVPESAWLLRSAVYLVRALSTCESSGRKKLVDDNIETVIQILSFVSAFDRIDEKTALMSLEIINKLMIICSKTNAIISSTYSSNFLEREFAVIHFAEALTSIIHQLADKANTSRVLTKTSDVMHAMFGHVMFLEVDHGVIAQYVNCWQQSLQKGTLDNPGSILDQVSSAINTALRSNQTVSIEPLLDLAWLLIQTTASNKITAGETLYTLYSYLDMYLQAGQTEIFLNHFTAMLQMHIQSVQTSKDYYGLNAQFETFMSLCHLQNDRNMLLPLLQQLDEAFVEKLTNNPTQRLSHYFITSAIQYWNLGQHELAFGHLSRAMDVIEITNARNEKVFCIFFLEFCRLYSIQSGDHMFSDKFNKYHEIYTKLPARERQADLRTQVNDILAIINADTVDASSPLLSMRYEDNGSIIIDRALIETVSSFIKFKHNKGISFNHAPDHSRYATLQDISANDREEIQRIAREMHRQIDDTLCVLNQGSSEQWQEFAQCARWICPQLWVALRVNDANQLEWGRASWRIQVIFEQLITYSMMNHDITGLKKISDILFTRLTLKNQWKNNSLLECLEHTIDAFIFCQEGMEAARCIQTIVQTPQLADERIDKLTIKLLALMPLSRPDEEDVQLLLLPQAVREYEILNNFLDRSDVLNCVEDRQVNNALVTQYGHISHMLYQSLLSILLHDPTLPSEISYILADYTYDSDGYNLAGALPSVCL